jgi:glutamine cyclotransferase
MRLITKESIQAFEQNRSFKKSNMEVEVLPCTTILKYQGNSIAFKQGQSLKITNCGWFSNTTKERLNALNGVSLYQKNFIWYLNGKEWDGQLIEVNK